MANNEGIRRYVDKIQYSHEREAEFSAESGNQEAPKEIVFNELPESNQLTDAINEAMSAAFSSSGVLRIRGAKRNC